mmetsp:Transcript_28448/g.55361  ORF Transcript_28448/g.55361 Transcript_28448/m.55361 type:complete len:582 (+) Transcript_28448:188-1933(+)
MIESIGQGIDIRRRMMYPMMLNDTYRNVSHCEKRQEQETGFSSASVLDVLGFDDQDLQLINPPEPGQELGLRKVVANEGDDRVAIERRRQPHDEEVEDEEDNRQSGGLLLKARDGGGHAREPHHNKHRAKPEPDVHADSNDDISVQSENSFAGLGFPRVLVSVLKMLGFESPSTIQKKALPNLINGIDGMVQSGSGTGKTSMLAMLVCHVARKARTTNSSKLHPQKLSSVIVSPTRELAKQTRDTINKMGLSMGMLCWALVGGHEFKRDLDALTSKNKHNWNNNNNNKGTNELTIKKERFIATSGTIGRSYQMVDLHPNVFASTKLLLIDEIDSIINEGFSNLLLSTKNRLPCSIQVCVTSATIDPNVAQLCEKILSNPFRILTKNQDLVRSGIKQYIVKVSADVEEKIVMCVQLYERVRALQTIIFCRKRSSVELLFRRFKNRGEKVAMVHRDVKQSDRARTLAEFKRQRIHLLISTDILARGIDVPSVMATINFDMPHQLETYMHRVGRAGRFYGKGLAITLVSPEDEVSLRDLRSKFAMEIPELKVKFRQNKPAISPETYHLGQLARRNYLRSRRRHS